MDVKREGIVEAKRRRRMILGSIGAVILALVVAALARLEPAPPSVRESEIYTGKVERGEMLRQVRGPGTLVPVEIRWIPALTNGTVERRVALPGAVVKADTVILELSNPEVQQAAQDALLELRAVEADFADLKIQLERQLLNEKANAARVESDYRQALLQAEADSKLTEDGLIPQLTARLSQLRADELANRNQIEVDRLAIIQKSLDAQLQARRARLDQSRALYELRRSQAEGLNVVAGIDGVLQQVPVEVGQQVSPGTNLARVARPDKLKAELRIAETQAKDVAIGLDALVDTRNGVVQGRVSRIDPAVQNGSVTVDVELIGELPLGARPDLSVDGTVELERLTDVLYVNRPAFGQAESNVSLFRLNPNGTEASRVTVELGRTSVRTVEVRSGLREGDEVILSDTSRWSDEDKLRINS